MALSVGHGSPDLPGGPELTGVGDDGHSRQGHAVLVRDVALDIVFAGRRLIVGRKVYLEPPEGIFEQAHDLLIDLACRAQSGQGLQVPHRVPGGLAEPLLFRLILIDLQPDCSEKLVEERDILTLCPEGEPVPGRRCLFSRLALCRSLFHCSQRFQRGHCVPVDDARGGQCVPELET